MNRWRLVLVSLGSLALLGATCDALAPKDYEQYSSTAGLLIGDGDADSGRVAFVSLRCHSCHTVDRITLPPLPLAIEEPIALGGAVSKLPSDGYLATAIINPSHDLAQGLPRKLVAEGGESRMADYSDVVTLRQLKDLVAFLQSRYRRAEEN